MYPKLKHDFKMCRRIPILNRLINVILNYGLMCRTKAIPRSLQKIMEKGDNDVSRK